MTKSDVFKSRWVLKVQNEQSVYSIAEFLEDYFAPFKKGKTPQDEETRKKLLLLLAKLFYNRGYREPEEITAFFSKDTHKIHDPFLLPDMEEAVDRINKAIEQKEKITVYGDYDVDGITSVSILCKYLLSLGICVDYYIPGRTDEGYGLNEQALDKIKETGTTLLITVDTGTTAIKETEYAKEIGLDVIITDHHECKFEKNESGEIIEKIPDCIAVVNPKRHSGNYPFADLAGVGVVFKLLYALTGNIDEIFAEYGDLTAIGTIADIMPLVNENRTLVVNGIKNLRRRASVGIRALLAAAGNEKEIDSSVIAYVISPRLNAAGRIGNPKMSIDLLLETNYEKALCRANSLCEKNRKRQSLEIDIFRDVDRMIQNSISENKILVFMSDEWHNGVIGIVASRIIEKYSRPCILLCGDGDILKGSARSVKGVNIFEMLQQVSGTLLKFGGHEMAAGLTLSREKYEEFKEKITEYANKTVTERMLIPTVEAECELSFSDLVLKTYETIRLLEPFGAGNPTPLFIVKELIVFDMESIGSGKHIKMRLVTKNKTEEPISALLFNNDINRINCTKGDEIDIICSLGENMFNGKKSLSINVKKIKLSNTIESNDKVQKLFYDSFKKNGKVLEDIQICRETVATVFRHIRQQAAIPIEDYNAYALARKLSFGNDAKIGYAQLMLSLDVLTELGLLSYSGSETLNIKFDNKNDKVDLQKSETWGKTHRA